MRLSRQFTYLIVLVAITLAAVFTYGYWRQKADTQDVRPNAYDNIRIDLITNSLTDSACYSKINHEVERFMERWELRGASVAVAYSDRLVYARGFGWANCEDSVKMQPYHVLRVASTSKLITATAVMKLVENGLLGLNDTVFGPNGILNDSIFLDIQDPRARQITVHNLLNHSAGWNVRYGDHMFMKELIANELGLPLPISLSNIVQFALGHRGLHFNPGSYSRYGNLGYAILQLVIEKVTGTPYEDWVKANLFKPLKINDVGIAQAWDSLKLPNEVRYYEVPEADSVLAYDGSRMALKSRGGNDIHTLGAAGGWAISAVSLVRFMLAIDGHPQPPDIIDQATVRTMTTNYAGYPYGWIMVSDSGDLWRSGSLPGTSVLAKSLANGFTFAFVTNSSPWKGSRFPYIINSLMNRLLPQFDSLMLQRDLLQNGGLQPNINN